MLRVGTIIASSLLLAALSRNAMSQLPLQPDAPHSPWPQAPSLPRQNVVQAEGTTAVAKTEQLPPGSGSPSAFVQTDSTRGAETLAEAWAAALSVDRQLESKRWYASSAEQTLALAHAERWPTLSVESSYTLRDHEPAFRFSNFMLPTDVFPYEQDENITARTRLNFPLYTSGRIGHNIDAAAADVDVREAEIRRSQMELKMRVAERYVAVLRAYRDLEVTESSVRSLDAHRRDVQMHFEHDRVPRNDLLAAQVALSDARQLAIQAVNHLDGSRATYNRILGRPLTVEVRLAEPPVPMGDLRDVESLTARALGGRPERARLAAKAEALRQRAESVRARGHPQMVLVGDYAFAENRFQAHEGITSVAVGVSWNLLDGGRSRFEASALDHRAEAVTRLAEDLESQIRLEVRRSWLDVHETRRRLAVTREALGQAEENLRVARNRYGLGVGVGTEVLDAQTLRAQTYRNHLNATYDAVLADLQLRRATGEL